MASVSTNIKIDKGLKEQSQELFESFGLSLSAAINLFLRQAVRELVKAYIYGLESAALDDVFELLAWNQGIGFFSSEIGPSPLFQAYKMNKTQEQRGISREEICTEIKEKFGEKNQEVQVL